MIEAQTANPSLKETNEQTIALNFLELDIQAFSFTVYRKPAGVNDLKTNLKGTGLRRYKLPPKSSVVDANYEEFLISLEPKEGYEEYICSSLSNHQLTCYFIFEKVLGKCSQALKEGSYSYERGFRNIVSFTLRSDAYGKEVIWVEPYYLKAKKLFGLLVGFSFKKDAECKLDKVVLQRSLSLDKNFRENRDYYADHYRKLEGFLSVYYEQLFPVELSDTASFNIIWPPTQLDAQRLKAKTYIFGGEKFSPSQFMGIKQHGPYKKLPNNALICFMYRPEDKPYSHDLYYALKGERYSTFVGMEKVFSFSVGKEHVTGIPLSGFDDVSIQAAIKQLKSIAGDRPVLPVIIFPWSRGDLSVEGEATYYRLKHAFLTHNMPSQMVSLNRLQNKEALKWSTANIALAIFSKLGGIPWKVKPEHEECLIIGISQAHRKNQDKDISRYFAYSVLTDSSGIYKSIHVLSDFNSEEQYLNGLVENLKATLKTYAGSYKRFVLHTTFTMRYKEMEAIYKAVHDFNEESDNDCKVTVIKFNDNDKFFGFSLWHNSKVPFESSYIKISEGEYLVWFEGLQYHDPTVKRRISRPMHIKFNYSTEQHENENKKYLQDALNLSGANWRGFNAKSLPVSIYYAKLIANYIGCFDELDLPEIDIENFHPWFL